MNVRTALKALFALSLLGSPAAFASPTVVDFTGTETHAVGGLGFVGDEFTGTLTFDLSNWVSSESSGTLGDSLNGFEAFSDGASIFDATITLDGISYGTAGQADAFSTVIVDPTGIGYYAASSASLRNLTEVDIQSQAVNTELALDDGTPNFAADGGFTGDLILPGGGRQGLQMSFTLDSITPANVPAPASLGLLGLGVIGAAFARRRKGTALRLA
jgi:hypothetical protein